MIRRDGAIMVWQAGIFAADGYNPNDLVILSDFGTSGAFKKLIRILTSNSILAVQSRKMSPQWDCRLGT